MLPTCYSPKRTKHGYLIKWTPVSLTLMDVKIDSATTKEIILKHLDAHSVKTIEQLDMHCMQQVHTHLPKWFSNHRVHSDELSEKHHLSLMDRIYLPTHVSSTKCIQYMEWNNKQYMEWETLLKEIENIHDVQGTIVVEAIGIYVHKSAFGIQWIVRRLELMSPKEDGVDLDMNLPDRADIEQQWSKEVHLVDKKIHEKIQELQKRIDALLAQKASIHSTLDHAKVSSISLKQWNDHLENLSQQILQLRSGSLFS
jgi:hypothetical protein